MFLVVEDPQVVAKCCPLPLAGGPQYALAHYVPALQELAEDDAVRQQTEAMLRRLGGTEAVYITLPRQHWRH